jgi:hypothetical protein
MREDIRSKIIAARDLGQVPVSIPEWTDDELFVRKLTGKERDRFEMIVANAKDDNDLEDMRAFIVTLTLVDGNGERIFSDEDIAIVNDKCGEIVNRVFEQAAELNALTKKSIEAQAKN